LFRIDRNNVNLGATKSVWVDNMGPEAGEMGEPHAAAASIEDIAQARASEILSKAEHDAQEAAQQIITQAREDAAKLLCDAREEAEQERVKAREEGFEQGAEEGLRSYDKRLSEKQSEDDMMLKRVLSEMYDERERTFSSLEEEVVGLSLEIVRKIIGPAEEELGGVFTALITNALRQISPVGKVVIHVSPQEYDRFFASGKNTIELESGEVISASILRDTSFGGGDLVIDTESETIDAGLNTQLKYIALAFEKQINV